MRFFSSPANASVRAAAVAAVTLASLGVAGSAGAATDSFRDARHDMRGHGADIQRVTVANNDKFVHIRIRHDDLVRSYRSGSSGTVYLDVDRSRKGPEFAFVGGLFSGTDYALERVERWVQVSSSVPTRGTYSMTLDYARDVTHITIGRRALGYPGAVRVAVRTGGYVDHRVVEDWLGSERELTPWVARG